MKSRYNIYGFISRSAAPQILVYMKRNKLGVAMQDLIAEKLGAYSAIYERLNELCAHGFAEKQDVGSHTLYILNENGLRLADAAEIILEVEGEWHS